MSERRIIDNDIETYTASLEDAQGRLRRAPFSREAYYQQSIQLHHTVLAALKNLRDHYDDPKRKEYP